METVFIITLVLVLILLIKLYSSCNKDVAAWFRLRPVQKKEDPRVIDSSNITQKVSEPSQSIVEGWTNDRLQENHDRAALDFQKRRPSPSVNLKSQKIHALNSFGTSTQARAPDI